MNTIISVILPSYGAPIFLEKAVHSVINQTYCDWELIVVDDNNPNTVARENTERVMAKFSDARISYIQHPYNKNGAAARNTGIAIAKGEYISFLDSDDEYLPERLEKSLGAISNAGKEYAGVFTGCEFRRKGKTYLKYRGVKTGRHLYETLAGNFMFCTGSNLFVKKNVVDKLGGFDESFQRHQDYEFLVRLFSQYSLIAIPEVLVVKNNENFNLPPVERLLTIKQQYLKKYQYLINSLSESERAYVYHTNYVDIAEKALLENKYKLSSELYSRAKAYKALSFKEWMRRIAFQILSFKHVK